MPRMGIYFSWVHSSNRNRFLEGKQSSILLSVFSYLVLFPIFHNNYLNLLFSNHSLQARQMVFKFPKKNLLDMRFFHFLRLNL